MSEKLFHVGVKGLIQSDDGKILLVQEDVSNHSLPTKPYWDIPGGRIQKGEDVIETLKREIKEETGFGKIGTPKFITAVISNHQIQIAPSQIVGLVLMVYKISFPKNEAVKLSIEHLAFDWFSPKAAAKLLTHKYPKEFCESISKL